MLPAMVIEDLSLEDALLKLKAAYVDACGRSGETPLPLTFLILPPGTTKKLTLHLPAGNLSTSVRLLATLSGMKASRGGREFRFEPTGRERQQVSREFRVPPNFNTGLDQMAGREIPPNSDPFEEQVPMMQKSVSECLRALGVDLDPSTRLTLRPSGILTLETSSAADADAISELAKVFTAQPPRQIKFTPMILEIPAGSTWSPPDGSQMTESEVQMAMRDLAQSVGTELISLPSATGKSGQDTRIEMTQEVVYPRDGMGGRMESRNTGKVLAVQGNLLGFGQDVAVNYTDTTVEYEPSTGKPTFTERTAMNETGFTSDGGSRFVVQTRPDGTKTVMFLTSTIIDATGRPIR